MDCSLPGSSVHGILQRRIMELLFPSPVDPPNPGIKLESPALPVNSLPAELLDPEKFSHARCHRRGKLKCLSVISSSAPLWPGKRSESLPMAPVS